MGVSFIISLLIMNPEECDSPDRQDSTSSVFKLGLYLTRYMAYVSPLLINAQRHQN
jgi:hypothetical protein